MNKEEILKQFLSENKLMQLATQSEGKLWVCNLYFVVGKNLNIYWTSARNRRHSMEVEANPIVAATIVNDEDKKQAVQIAGKAYRITPEESQYAHETYGNKLGQKDSRMDEVNEDTKQSRAYWVLKPDYFELWDEVNYPDEPKQRIEIKL